MTCVGQRVRMQNERLEKMHPYRASLNRVTQIGLWTGAIFEITYSILYWFAGPRMASWINIIGVTFVLLSTIAFKYNHPLFAAHLLTLSLYISVIGVSIITGGVDASSISWLAFVGAVATLMTGVWGGLIWGIIAVLSLAAVYIAQVMGMLVALTVRPSTSLDRLIDYAGLILVIGVATVLSEYTRRKVLFELNHTQIKMEHLAIMDPLTRTYNRRYFLEWITQWSKDGSRADENATLILFDVDHFKTVNDTYGHMIGDQILCGITDICSQVLRSEDVFARFGGEGFVIFLPGADLAIGEQVAERLRAMIESMPIQTEIGPTCVTISLGVVAVSTLANVKLNEFIRRADQAMYHSKRLGRNRVTKWGEGIARKKHAYSKENE